jgi:hypothetical protein
MDMGVFRLRKRARLGAGLETSGVAGLLWWLTWIWLVNRPAAPGADESTRWTGAGAAAKDR